jgi:enoyl-CoA hydratase/carnithine racemase
MNKPTDDAAQTVLAQRLGPVLVLTLNRPGRLNAWTDAMEERYFHWLAKAESDPDVRAIVVTGAGRGFCAGADFSDLAQVEVGPDAQPRERALARYYPLSIRKPIIAAINGAAAGLGLVEALYCDVRFAVPDAKLTTAFTRRGLIAEYGASWLLERIVGYGAALDLLLSGRVITGREALTIGLVNRLADPENLLTEAIDYAQDLATYCSPNSVAVVKQQVHDAAGSHFQAAAAGADRAMREALGRTDVKEGVASYLENRTPRFPGLSAAKGEQDAATLKGDIDED